MHPMTVLAIIAAFLLLMGIPWLSERRLWNKGRYPKCWWSHWVYFDTDSQGGRGYKCSINRDHVIWISWPFIDPPRAAHSLQEGSIKKGGTNPWPGSYTSFSNQAAYDRWPPKKKPRRRRKTK